MQISSPSLSKDELDDLFRQCDDVDTRTQSALSSPRTPRPTLNPRNNGDHSAIGSQENEPTGSDTSRTAKLDNEILRKLLEEAKHGLGFEETFTDGSDIPEGISFGEEENYTQNNDDSLNEENQGGRRLLQNSSSKSA